MTRGLAGLVFLAFGLSIVPPSIVIAAIEYVYRRCDPPFPVGLGLDVLVAAIRVLAIGVVAVTLSKVYQLVMARPQAETII